MINSSSNIGRTAPLTPIQRPQTQAAPAPAPAAAPPTEAKPTLNLKDENKAKTFEETPMEEVNTANFKQEKAEVAKAAEEIAGVLRLEEPEEAEEVDDTEAAEGPEEAESASETEALEEGEAPEEAGEAEEAAEIEAAEEEEEETGTDSDFDEERESEGAEEATIDFELLYGLIENVQQAPAFELERTWNLFLLK
jgi:hypothetical protein